MSVAQNDPRCRGGLEPAERRVTMATGELAMGEPPDGPVAEVVVEGLVTVPVALVRAVLELPTGVPIDPAVVRGDVTRILALEAFEDVEVRADTTGRGVVVRYRAFERPLVDEVHVVGQLLDEPAVRIEPGEVYSPQRMFRARRRLVAELARDGYPEAAVDVHAWRPRPDRVGVCLSVAPGRLWRVAQLSIEGNERVDGPELAAFFDAHDGRVNTRGGVYRADLLAIARRQMTALYYDRGMLDVVVEEPTITWRDDELSIEVQVSEGSVYRVGVVSIAGTPRATVDEHLALAHLEPDEVFSRTRFMALLERMKQLEASRRGHEVAVTPRLEMDRERHVVDVELVVGAPAAAPTAMDGASLREGGSDSDSEPTLDLDSRGLFLDSSLGTAL